MVTNNNSSKSPAKKNNNYDRSWTMTNLVTHEYQEEDSSDEDNENPDFTANGGAKIRSPLTSYQK